MSTEAGTLVAITGEDGLIRFNTVAKVRTAPPGDVRYMCAGIRLYRTVEISCDEDGYVCKRVGSDGSVVYYNRFNGWHSGPSAAVCQANRGGW